MNGSTNITFMELCNAQSKLQKKQLNFEMYFEKYAKTILIFKRNNTKPVLVYSVKEKFS